MATRQKIGSITSGFDHFHEWKRLSESEPGVVSMETLLKGVCNKHNFIDIFENFIVFDDSTGKQIKILVKNHQYLGVNQVITALTDPQRQKGKLGVFGIRKVRAKVILWCFSPAKYTARSAETILFDLHRPRRFGHPDL